MLALTLLGAPLLERDGAPIAVDTRKATALVAYLAVTGQAHTRDALCALLWPESDHEHARGALRRTLSALRAALGAEWIEAGRDRVELRRAEGLRVDVDEFRRRLADADANDPVRVLTEAVALYRGDLLAGFAVRDSANFDDWQYLEAEGLRRELAEALERLVDAHAARGEHERAIVYARRWLSLNPLHETVHRRLMELSALKGERAGALRQYRECVRVLQAELGVAPLEETTALHRSIQENRIKAVRSPDPGAARPRPGTPRPDLPLVGRTSAWRSLADAWTAVRADGRLVVIEGEAGIGKTRLVDDFLAHVEQQGARTIRVRCHEGEETLAYGAAAEAARGAMALGAEVPPSLLEEVGRLVPEIGSSPRLPLDSPGAQSRFFQAVSRFLVAAVEGPPPGVLLIEDVHWIDESSFDLASHLVRRLRGQPILAVLSWRSEEVPAGHRLRRLATEVEQVGLGVTLRLARLARTDADELAKAVPGAAPELGRRLHEESEGLPLLAVECLAALARGEDPWGMSGGVRELLGARLASLSAIARQVLAAAAVVGRPFGAETVGAAAGRSDDEVVAGIEELVERGLIAETGDAYDFRHDAMRTLAYDGTSLARRQLLHRRVAGALEGRTQGRADVGARASVIAHHYERAGHPLEAAEHLVRAGDHARSLYANADALTHLRGALDLGHPDIAGLNTGIGDLQTLLGRYAEAAASYEMAAAHAAPPALAALEHKLGELHGRRGDWQLAEGHLLAALAAAEDDDSVAQARIHADLALCAHRRGDDGRASQLAEEALELAKSVAEPSTLAQAHNVVGILRGSAGETTAARRHLETSLELATGLDDLGARVAALNNLALALRKDGDHARAVVLTEEALSLCAQRGDRHREAALHNNLADLLHADGRGEEAMGHLKQAVTLFAEVGEDGAMEPEIWKLVGW